jgi:dTDP-4-dehydrorhamnose reductase
MQKILIIGREGQLGSTIHDLTKKISWAGFSFTSIDTLDLTNREAIAKFFSNQRFDFVINCAAYTAVDKAENDQEPAFRLNAQAPEWLGIETANANTRVIHISTDYVFGGRHFRPLKPDDSKNPESVYGQSKLKGEEALMTSNPNSMIIRTSWLYSRHGQNFLKTMLRLGEERNTLKVVFDQIGTPTLADDLAEAILHIVKKIILKEITFSPGIYHYSNEGVCSWFDFATAIFNETGIKCSVIPVESDQFPTTAPRPLYSVMDKSLIKNTYKIKIPHWQESLKKCIEQMPLNITDR